MTKGTQSPAFGRYVALWLSQAVSQLGSAMTSYALILQVFQAEKSALDVSLMAFCSYVPYVAASLIAGGFVDRHRKKTVMMAADTVAALGTLAVLLLAQRGALTLWTVCAVNAVTGLANAFQSPAAQVAVGRMVPRDKLARVSGMNSFSGNLVTVLAPVLAAAVFAWGGLAPILTLDLASFAAAMLVLALVVRVPEDHRQGAAEKAAPLRGAREGLRFLRAEKGLLILMLTMAAINFFSRLTYENILSPMVLLRSGGDVMALGIVNAAMGVGGILGGAAASVGKLPRDKVRLIYGAAALSFLLGDVTMGLGRSAALWAAAGFAASFPIPFLMAGQNVLLYARVPAEMQGRVFAVRNAIQYSTIPAGILLGGFLADKVFEPLVAGDTAVGSALRALVGGAAGGGMAVMFLCTGVCGCVISLLAARSHAMDPLRQVT